MTRSPPPLDHGAIGNGRIIALVSPTSAIEWLCMPRFDSPSVFARLLDQDRGGVFRILWNGAEVRGELRYLRNTNILVTRFDDGNDAFEVIDFAPWLPRPIGHHAPAEIVRIMRPVRGAPRLQIDLSPALDYARAPTDCAVVADGVTVESLGHRLHLATNLPPDYVAHRRDFVLRHTVYLSLAYGARGEPTGLAGIQEMLELTTTAWRNWAKSCALPSFAPDAVLRSALCLKLHVYTDTGAVIAAATTSIPEAMGTPRAWDYRYCWLRDAAFVVEALRRLSHLREGEKFVGFLRDLAAAGPLQPLYSLDGGRELPEEPLPHLAGFGGNGWVRIGNAAAHQRQNDLMGELILCLQTFLCDPRLVHEDEAATFPLVRRLVEEAIAAADVPDTSIWEFRSLLRNYTFSRAMCWVAAERGASLARRLGDTDLAMSWQAHADREKELILLRGYSERLGYFTQALDGQFADASLLLLPTLGLLDAHDPRFISTLDAYACLLAPDGLMRRYHNDDDFGATTSAFTICSFWWAEALALAGRLDEAVRVFERVCAFANPVGLFSEDIDPATGALLGNFPQAYTHVGLINAAMTIGDLLDARDGRVRAWAQHEARPAPPREPPGAPESSGGSNP
jgi:GH15 family glucan-1,4-alpha-glucosidase